MQFNPNIPIVTRQGTPMKDGKDSELAVTTGSISVFVLDNTNDNVDAPTKRFRFRLATEIQDAINRGTTVEIKSDELEKLDELLAKAMNTLVYGQFHAFVEEMKEAAKQAAAKPNGKHADAP